MVAYHFGHEGDSFCWCTAKMKPSVFQKSRDYEKLIFSMKYKDLTTLKTIPRKTSTRKTKKGKPRKYPEEIILILLYLRNRRGQKILLSLLKFLFSFAWLYFGVFRLTLATRLPKSKFSHKIETKLLKQKGGGVK